MIKSFSFNGYRFEAGAKCFVCGMTGAWWTSSDKDIILETQFIPEYIPVETIKSGCPSRTKYIKCRREDVVRIFNGDSYKVFKKE